MNKMKAGSATVDSRAAWIVAGASLIILTIAYGAPCMSACRKAAVFLRAVGLRGHRLASIRGAFGLSLIRRGH
jgi:hypothetical protein